MVGTHPTRAGIQTLEAGWGRLRLGLGGAAWRGLKLGEGLPGPPRVARGIRCHVVTLTCHTEAPKITLQTRFTQKSLPTRARITRVPVVQRIHADIAIIGGLLLLPGLALIRSSTIETSEVSARVSSRWFSESMSRSGRRPRGC